MNVKRGTVQQPCSPLANDFPYVNAACLRRNQGARFTRTARAYLYQAGQLN